MKRVYNSLHFHPCNKLLLNVPRDLHQWYGHDDLRAFSNVWWLEIKNKVTLK